MIPGTNLRVRDGNGQAGAPLPGQAVFAEKNDWPTPGDSTTFYWSRDGVGGMLRTEYERFAGMVGSFRLRRPAESTDGLLGPFLAAGECLHPILPDGCRLWYDPKVRPVNGDLVLVEWAKAEIEDLMAGADPGWMKTYGAHDISRAAKWFRQIDGHDLLIARNTAFALGDSRIIGVLRFVEIAGRPAYGSGTRQLPAIDRNPKLITLDGVPTFVGPSPPASPKVGWLWRDSDTNILFRWDGAAWVDYATETKLASQIDYLDGASVESLEPAEAAADVTAPRILGNGLLNPGLETGTLEGWETVSGTWNVVITEPRFGTYHLEASASTGVLQILNDSRLQVEEGDRVLAHTFVQRTGTAGAEERNIRADIRWINENNTLIGTEFGDQITSTDYKISRAIGVAPAGTVTAQFQIRSPSHGGDAQGVRADGAFMQIIPRGADIVLNDASGVILRDQVGDQEVLFAVVELDTATHLFDNSGDVDIAQTDPFQVFGHNVYVTLDYEIRRVSGSGSIFVTIWFREDGGPWVVMSPIVSTGFSSSAEYDVASLPTSFQRQVHSLDFISGFAEPVPCSFVRLANAPTTPAQLELRADMSGSAGMEVEIRNTTLRVDVVMEK